MPLSPPPPGQPGGMLLCEYVNANAGERHSLRMHVAWYDPTALGADNDRAYNGAGPVSPGEARISDTYAALAGLWQPYYSSDWILSCRSLGYNAGGALTLLTPAPLFASYAGTDPADHSGDWFFERKIRLLGRTGTVRRLYLEQVAGTVLHDTPLEVGPDGGGIDPRDRAWMAYLSGASGGGAVMPDGTYCFPVSDMSAWWGRAPIEGWVSAPGSPSEPGAPYVVVG